MGGVFQIFERGRKGEGGEVRPQVLAVARRDVLAWDSIWDEEGGSAIGAQAR